MRRLTAIEKSIRITSQTLRNFLMRFEFVVRWRTKAGRTATHEIWDSAVDRYAYKLFEEAEKALSGSLSGKCVAEIGPGDHIPAALLFLGAGANRYVCYDRFLGDLGSTSAKTFYSEVIKSMKSRRPDIYSQITSLGIEADSFPFEYPKLVRAVHKSIEEVQSNDDEIDLMVSCNVLEHLSSVWDFAEGSFNLLKPGGQAIHRVDFGGHGWGSCPNPLEFLTISDFWWDMMGSNRGQPNRVRYGELNEAFEGVGYEIDTVIIERYPDQAIDSIRDALLPRFKNTSQESLSVMSAWFYLKKPA